MQNFSGDRNTRIPDLPPEKSVCRSRSNNENWMWNSRLVPKSAKEYVKEYIVTLII